MNRFTFIAAAFDGTSVETQIIEKMIRRYGINYVASRAVTLFDIVGFSLLTPFEQMTQLNSLSYSLNSAHAKMLERRRRPQFCPLVQWRRLLHLESR